MRLLIDPPVPLLQLNQDLELVMLICGERMPEMFLSEGVPHPDRHLLLGIVQTVAVRVEERDPDSVFFSKDCSVILERGPESRPVQADLIISRSLTGAIGVLVMADHADGRRMCRRAVRWFMGTIRLDVP